jgi:hypothetical protein
MDVSALPCRPTIACTADFVRPGALEIEAGYIGRQLSGGIGQRSLPVLFKLTLARWFQLQVGSNGYTFQRGPVAAQYFDNVMAGGKVHLLDQTAALPSASLSAALGVPTFAGQTGYTRVDDAFFTAYVTKDFGLLHADFNVGVNEWDIGASWRAQPFAALAFSAPLPPLFGVMAEGYVFGDAGPLAPRDGGFLFAMTHAPEPWLVFDLGGDVGLFPTTRAWSVFVGMTVVPVVLWGVPSRS